VSVDLLLAKFELIAKAPGAVGRLRRFVLDLAVRGRLVPQDPADESASKLLARISVTNARRQPGSSDNRLVQSAQIPFRVPSGWAWIPLGHLIVGSDAGWSPKTESFARNNDNWGVLKVSAVSWDSFRPEENKQLLPGVLPRLGAQVHAGDFLISRANTSELVAKAVVVSQAPSNLMLSDKIVRLTLVEEAVPQFLLLVNNHAHYAREYYAREASGASPSMKNVSREVIYRLPVPLPPFDEQHRIVAEVNELMAVCDELEAAQEQRESRRDALRRTSLQRLTISDRDTASTQEDVRFFLDQSPRLITKPEHVAAVQQSILNLALTGRLVEAVDSDGDADVLVAAARAAKRDSDARARMRPSRSIPATVADHVLPTLPWSWRWARLDEIADIVGGVTKDDKNQGLPGLIEIPYLRVANVQRGYLDLAKVTTIKVPTATASYLQLLPGDILFNEGGDRDKLGRGWIWEGQIEHCIHQNHVFRARLYKPIVDPRIVSWHGNTFGQKWFIEGGKQTTNLASVNKTTLRAFPVPIPPFAQQHRIVVKVNELMAVCDELETALANAQTERGRLLEALLHGALNEAARPLATSRAVAGTVQ
jgi:type I restriction enzyme, S subunit